ncbi:hypothetical protein [Streptomyces sp. S4.7]|uniref:hypothetical protein n=1 Tax=Streptomyces sp. S4.7 TaxID=2705439 RepID=UPI001EF31B3E|nr:hypothetical protein [Streptomyces sp. S4.7]
MSRGVPLGSGAESRRELRDACDVIVDDLASRVLVLNLPGTGQGLGQWLTDAARYGTPAAVDCMHETPGTEPPSRVTVARPERTSAQPT